MNNNLFIASDLAHYSAFNNRQSIAFFLGSLSTDAAAENRQAAIQAEWTPIQIPIIGLHFKTGLF